MLGEEGLKGGIPPESAGPSGAAFRGFSSGGFNPRSPHDIFKEVQRRQLVSLVSPSFILAA